MDSLEHVSVYKFAGGTFIITSNMGNIKRKVDLITAQDSFEIDETFTSLWEWLFSSLRLGRF